MIRLPEKALIGMVHLPPLPGAAGFSLRGHSDTNDVQNPLGAIIESAGTSSVLVEEDGKAIRKVVRTGYGADGMIEITDGLVDDENVITVGHVGLKRDSKVTVINRPADDESADESVCNFDWMVIVCAWSSTRLRPD